MIHSSNLPSLTAKPSYLELLELLTFLEIKLPTWVVNVASSEDDSEDVAAVNAWLPTIFRSDLQWFNGEDGCDDESTADERREEIMEMAAKRLTERCGRSATSDISRTWSIPCSLISGALEDIHIHIHEPGMTEGNTGHKTWGTAFALIKELSALRNDLPTFCRLLGSKVSTVDLQEYESETSPRQCVLELGSGTGLLGIAASAIWKRPVILTDLEVIIPNLKRNSERNMQTALERGGNLFVETLSWSEHDKAARSFIHNTNIGTDRFKIILASDTLYDEEQVDLLANTINRFLDVSPEACALVAVPLRDRFCKELVVKFEAEMGVRGFALVDSGLLVARDDWGSGNEEVMIRRDVYCRRTP